MSSLREELVRQHIWLDQALNDLGCAAETGEPADVQGTWSTFEHGLVQHLEFEERELFPLVEPFHAEGVESLRGEHERIRKLVADLGVRAELHALRKETVDDLVEALRRHAEHEDRTLHRWLEEHAPEDTRRHLLSLFIKSARADLREHSDSAGGRA